jgi:hypothetical protein
MVWCTPQDLDMLGYERMLRGMLTEAKTEGYEPFDLNWADKPNVYLRGLYDADSGRYLGYGFAMFVRPVAKGL